jgi:hypothetical protein
VDLCIENEVDALVVSGALFDEQRLSVPTEDFLVEQVGRLDDADIDLVLSGTRSTCAAAMAWNHARVLWLESSPDAEVVLRRDGQVIGRVVAPSHGGAEPAHDPVDAASALQDDPSSVVVRASGNQPAVVMPSPWALGPLVGRHFGEPGVRGALLVDVPAKGEIVARFLPVSPLRWETIELVDPDGVGDAASLARRAAEVLAERCPPAGSAPESRWMLRVLLRGSSRGAELLSDEELLQAAGEQLARGTGACFVEFIDGGLVRPVDVSAHRGQPHLLGLALDVVDDLALDDDLLDRVAPAELAGCTTGDAEAKRAYVRALLDDVEASVAEALVKED